MARDVDLAQGVHSMESQDDLGRRLDDWSHGVSSYMKRTRYARWAEEIGQQMAVDRLELYLAGHPIPPWTGSLDDVTLKEANSIGRRLTPPTVSLDEHRVSYIDSDEQSTSMGRLSTDFDKQLKKEFTRSQIKGMYHCCGAEDRPTQRKLAKAAHVPERSFKRKISRLRERGDVT